MRRLLAVMVLAGLLPHSALAQVAGIPPLATFQSRMAAEPFNTFESRMANQPAWNDRFTTNSGRAVVGPSPQASRFEMGGKSSAAADPNRPGQSIGPMHAPAQVGMTSGPADVIRFDHRNINLQRTGQRWQLVSGLVMVKDFGTDEEAARESLRLIRILGLNERVLIGKPWPVMEYWLADGKAPQAGTSIARLVSIDNNSLDVVQYQGQWCVRDQRQILLCFGPYAADAEQARRIIQQYNFNRMTQIGRGTTAMMLFLTGAPPNLVLLSSEQNPGKPSQRIPPGQMAMVNALFPDSKLPGDRIRLDWRRVDVMQNGSSWQLLLDGYCLADHGTDERMAREALRVFKHYHFTEQCRIGQGAGAFTYYLSNGQPPRGVLFGLTCVRFRPENLELRRSSSGWLIHDGNQAIAAFPNRELAELGIEAIRQSRFNCMCRVGDVGPAPLTFLVRDW